MSQQAGRSTHIVSRDCPVCGGNESREHFRKQTLRIVKCPRCLMVFADPIEVGWVDGTYYDQLSGPFYLSKAKLEGDYARPRFARELKLFRRFCSGGRVLDVGCSTGGFLYQLRTQFPGVFETLGMDIAGPALDYAASMGCQVVRESYLDTSIPASSVSAITFWAVMEHLANPSQFLAQTARLLEPGGYCFILVPNFESLAVRLLGRKYRYIFPQHVNYFCRSTLRLMAAGEPVLKLVHETSMHFNPFVIVQDCCGTGAFVSDQERADLLKRTTAYKQSSLMAPLRFLLGGFESFLSRLNLADNSVIVLRKSHGVFGGK